MSKGIADKEREDRKEKLKAVLTDVWNFKESPLYIQRVANKYLPVIGEGSHFAEIMFIGEAPGKNEAMTGKPFCGAAGRVLDELLESVGVNREDVYVTNIVKDRPPLNRDPYPKEIDMYGPFLDRQIEIIRPKVIATLGRFSMEWVMKRFGAEESLQSISKIHGNIFDAELNGESLRICPLFHPCVAVYNPHRKEELKLDIKNMMEKIF